MGRIHVLPTNDVLDHEEAIWCPCSPEERDDVIVHNSFDGREHFEPNHDKENCKFCQTEPIEANLQSKEREDG